MQPGQGFTLSPRIREGDRVERDISTRPALSVTDVMCSPRSLHVKGIALRHTADPPTEMSLAAAWTGARRRPVRKPGPLAREGACDGTADRAPGSVEHRDLVLRHVPWSLLCPVACS